MWQHDHPAVILLFPPIPILVYDLLPCSTCPSDYNLRLDVSAQGPAPLKSIHILSQLAKLSNRSDSQKHRVGFYHFCVGLKRTRE